MGELNQNKCHNERVKKEQLHSQQIVKFIKDLCNNYDYWIHIFTYMGMLRLNLLLFLGDRCVSVETSSTDGVDGN